MVRTCSLNNYSDIHFTNKDVAKLIVNYFKPNGICLEPFAGDGAFLSCMPPNTLWCEISKGKDFLKFEDKVDWIITNPPFEELTLWMKHAFDVAQHVVFLIPLSKLFSSAPRMELVRIYGGIKTILYLGSGRKIGFDIGFPFGAIYFQKDYVGNCEFVYL